MSPSKSKNLTPSYAVIQGLYWMYFAAIMSFSGFFLLSGGFTNTQIGILAAIAGLLSAVLQPVLAGYADQPQSPSLKKLIQMLYLLQLILVIGLFLSHSLILTGLLYGSSIALLQLMTPFINSLGSVLGSFLGGTLIDLAGVHAMLLFSTVSAFIGALIVLIFAERTSK